MRNLLLMLFLCLYGYTGSAENYGYSRFPLLHENCFAGDDNSSNINFEGDFDTFKEEPAKSSKNFRAGNTTQHVKKPLRVTGNTYYISTTGNNSNPGSITSPWKTLAYAGSRTSSGDIIHVLPGNYTETAACVLPLGVSIEGEGLTSHITYTYSGDCIQLISGSGGTNGNQHISGLWLDGSNWTAYTGINTNRSNVTIFNCTVEKFRNDGIKFVNNNTPAVYMTGCELYNCILNNNSSRSTGQGSLVAAGYRVILIHDNIFDQTGRAAGSNGNTFSATTAFYNEGFKFYNNKSYRNEDEGSEWSFHLELWDSQGGTEIYNNEFYGGCQQIDFGGNDLTKGTYAYGAYVHDNLFQFDTPVQTAPQYQDIGVNIEGNCEYITIANNHFKNVPYGVQMTLGHTSTGQSNITIRNNLFENGGYVQNEWAFDIDIIQEGVGSYVDGLYVYNNTFVTNSLSALFISMKSNDVVNNVQFINNIVKGVRSYGYITFSGEPGNKNNWTVKNNLLYQNSNNNTFQVQSGATLPSNWTYTGNFVANPLLDASFNLTANSPGIDAGINVGLPYCSTAPDCGWKDYCLTGVPPVANAGADQIITLPTNNVNLSGTATTSNSISAWNWQKVTDGNALIGTPNAQITAVSGLIQQTYLFVLTVTDNAGLTDTDTIQVTVNAAVNRAPTANAGADQTITLPTNSVFLSGSGTDPDGTISAYLWTKISGPTAGSITNVTSAATTVTGLTQGIYKFELKVTDNNGATDTDTLQVTVNAAANLAPSANAGADQTITLPTNTVSLSGSGTDPDGTISTYLWTKISGPTAGSITNATSAATTVTGLAQGTYQFQLTVTDNNGATGTDVLRVTVNAAVNLAPTANAGADQAITLPTNSVSLSGSGTDPDGTISAYLWTKISGPTAGSISNATSAATTVTGLTQGIYKFELKVTDNNGATDTDTLQVTVNAAANQAPTANAGADQAITLPTNSVSLSGSGTDPDGTISAYLWTKISGPTAGSITNATSAATSVTGLVQGTYQFQLTVTDNNGASANDIMQVTVNAAANLAPSANAGADQSITLPTNSISISGSGTDPDGTISTYLWTKISGPTAGSISNATSAVTTVTGLVQGVYQFQLTVTDNNGASANDIMQVTVNTAANLAPSANAGADQTITLPTNTVSLSGAGMDPDGSISAYLWTKISGPASGTITSSSSAVTTVTGLVQGVYQFQITVTDNNGATGTDFLQVTVNAAANLAPIANAGADLVITLPVNTVSLSGSGTDADGTITAYRWRKISGPTAGNITSTTSAATTVTGLVQGIYQFELRVTDNIGATSRDTMQVTVNPAPNQAPTANAGADQTITLPTNFVTVTGTGNDPDGSISSYQWSKVSGPAAGTITTTSSASTSITGLVQGVYLFEFMVTDNNGATDKDSIQVTVNPAPNQFPVANAGSNLNITLPTNTVTLNGSGTDPDGSITGYLWTQISGPATSTIANANNATTNVTGLVAGVYQFALTVTDNNGASNTDIVQVNVNTAPPPPNQLPVANAGFDQNITLPTNSVSLHGSGTDPDGTITAYLWRKISGPFSFTITSNASASTSVTGLVQGVYRFELKVTDNSGATDLDTIQVTVNPAPNQLPTANAGADKTITLPTNSVSLNGSGTDPDGTISAYLWRKISGPLNGTITNTASATTSATGLVQGVYQFELKVTDNSGATDVDTMQVTVNPAPNQLPIANAGLNQTITLPINTVTLSGSGTDPDGSITAYSWIKVSGPAGGTITNPNTAITTITGLVQGVYQFELTVTDNSGATATDLVQVNVNPAVNQPPTANAGTDQNITLPTNSVSLNGSGTDPDGSITAYLWRKISGPTGGTIGNTASATTSVTGLTQGVYKFELKVTDNSGASDLDTMQVTVNPAANQPPTANAGLDQNITLPTNSVSLNGSGTDPDGSITAYLWRKISGPTGGTIGNTASATTSVTGLTQGVYKFELKVTDNSGATDLDTMQVTVNPAVNQPPTANAGNDLVITLPTNSVSLNGSGTDPDGSITAYLWRKISGPTGGTIGNTASATTSVTGLTQGVYKFELKVTDNSGASDLDTMQVTVNPAVNQPPTANAGLDQNITLPTNSVSLNGSGTDPDGSITAYLWRKISGPTGGTIGNTASATTSVTGLIQGVYKFELKVTDNSGATDLDTMQVTVNDVVIPGNIPPTAFAGNDTSIYLPEDALSLTGYGIDPDGTIVSYSWNVISGGAYVLTNANDSVANIKNLQQGFYEVELTVTDNNGATGKDTMKIMVGAGRLRAADVDDVIILGNPVGSTLNAKILSYYINRKIIITLVNEPGVILIQKEVMITDHEQVEKLDMSKYQMGTYYLKVTFSPGNRKVKGILKQ